MTLAAAEDSLLLSAPMTLSEAAHRLRITKAQVAEMVLYGKIPLVQPMRVDRIAVENLAAERALPGVPLTQQTSPAPGRLTRVPDRVLWLMADWGGRARTTDVRIALTLSKAPMSSALKTLLFNHYIQRLSRGGYELTEEGWAYTQRYQPPV